MNKKLNPYYIAGLIHADGGFLVSKHIKGKNIWLSPKIHLTLESKHRKIIEHLIQYWNTGYYKIDNRGYCRLTVSNINDIVNIIIPFFLKYQIHGEKFKSFIMFKIICEKIINKEHYMSISDDNKTLYYLLNSAYHMNTPSNINKTAQNELLRYLNEEKRNIVLNDKIYYQDLINTEIKKYQNFNLNIDFIKGLFDGDGNITLYLTNKTKIRMNFNIVQYKTEKILLEKICRFFDNKGNIYLNEGKNSQTYRYETKSIKKIKEYILPKFDNFDNGIDYNIKLYKLKLIYEFINWMNENQISSISNKNELMKYININYLIFKNPKKLTFDEYKNQMMNVFNFTT